MVRARRVENERTNLRFIVFENFPARALHRDATARDVTRHNDARGTAICAL